MSINKLMGNVHCRVGVAVMFMAIICIALPVRAGVVQVYNYGQAQTPVDIRGHLTGTTLNLTVNNTEETTLKDSGTWDDVYKPGAVVINAANYDLSSLTGVNISAALSAPSNAYVKNGRYGLAIIDGGGRSAATSLQWTIQGFNSQDAGFGSMVQIGGGMVGSDTTGESVELTFTGVNNFGSYTYFGGRGTVRGGDAKVVFASGNETSFGNADGNVTEVNFGGCTHTGTGGFGEVYFNSGIIMLFGHQNAYFGGNAKQGIGGETYVEFNCADVSFQQRAVFGGIGFLNSAYSTVNFNGGNVSFTYDNTTESNYRGVYFSAMGYHDEIYHSSHPYIYAESAGTKVTFNGGNTTFNVLTLFGGSYDLNRIGGGDKDRTWGGEVNVTFANGVTKFENTTILLSPSEAQSRNYYRWEGGTYFGGPGSTVNVNFTGGRTYFMGQDAICGSPSGYTEEEMNQSIYVTALSNANGYEIFNSTNYADEVQFGGKDLEAEEWVLGSTGTLHLAKVGNYEYQDGMEEGFTQKAVTNVNISGGKVYFDNVRATFGGRQGYYTTHNSYVAENDPTQWATKDASAILGWSGGIDETFFTETQNNYGKGYRNLFQNSGEATLTISGTGQLRMGVNALLTGVAAGTSLVGTGGTIMFDAQAASGLNIWMNGNEHQLDVGTIYFNSINLNGTTVDISRPQDLEVGTYKSDIALMTGNGLDENGDLSTNSNMNFSGTIGESNRFYNVSLESTDGDKSKQSLVVNMKKTFEVDDNDGNIGKNKEEINTIIHHFDNEISEEWTEILKEDDYVTRHQSADLFLGAIHASMASVQVQRISTLNNMIANQLYMEDSGRNCYAQKYREMYQCGPGNQGVMYDQYGNAYPAYGNEDPYCHRRFEVWARAYGYTGDTEMRHGFSGYDQETFGGVVGIQFNPREHVKLGFYYGYADTSIETVASMGQASVSSTDNTIGFYLKWNSLVRSGYHLFNMNYSFSDNEAMRTYKSNSFSSEYDSNMGSIYFEKGWDWCVCERFTLNPYLGLQYVHYTADPFQERGMGLGAECSQLNDPLRLSVDKLRYDSLRSQIGARFVLNLIPRYIQSCDPCCSPDMMCTNTPALMCSNHDLKLVFNAAWVYEWLDGQADMNVTFPGYADQYMPKYRVFGNGGGISWANLGAGLNYTFRDRLTLGAYYDLFINSYTTVHSGTAAVTIAF
ncbi:MAG: autotransporter outer membrane beta-barrel domain-containing protein [Planctomycetia bacterium]|nr:autotransporter outer membrane beta-barrel domain-containing protein [Planctomycetia bacterium]